MGWPSAVVAVAVIAAGVTVLVDGPGGGDWAGAQWMFIPLCAFAGAGAVECLRGALGDSRTAWVLAAVLGVQSLFYVMRTTVFAIYRSRQRAVPDRVRHDPHQLPRPSR